MLKYSVLCLPLLKKREKGDSRCWVGNSSAHLPQKPVIHQVNDEDLRAREQDENGYFHHQGLSWSTAARRKRWRPGPALPNHCGSWRRPPCEPRAEPCCGFLTTSPQTTEQPGQAEAVFLAQPAIPCCLGSAGSGIPKSLLQTLRSALRQHHPGTNRNLRKISSHQQQPCCGRSQLPVHRLWRRQSPKLCHDGLQGSFFWLQDELSVPSHPQPPRGSWQLSVVTTALPYSSRGKRGSQ